MTRRIMRFTTCRIMQRHVFVNGAREKVRRRCLVSTQCPVIRQCLEPFVNGREVRDARNTRDRITDATGR